MKKEVKKQILSVVLGIGMVFSIKLIVFISRKQNNHNFISNQIVVNKLEEIQHTKWKNNKCLIRQQLDSN